METLYNSVVSMKDIYRFDCSLKTINISQIITILKFPMKCERKAVNLSDLKGDSSCK